MKIYQKPPLNDHERPEIHHDVVIGNTIQDFIANLKNKSKDIKAIFKENFIQLQDGTFASLISYSKKNESSNPQIIASDVKSFTDNLFDSKKKTFERDKTI